MTTAAVQQKLVINEKAKRSSLPKTEKIIQNQIGFSRKIV
jgi:hypothetical protein